MEPIPDFDEACCRLRDFLGDEDLSPEFLWLFREDVTFSRGRWWVRIPVPEQNEVRARELYDQARARGIGIRINAELLLDSRPCCALQLPISVSEAADTWSLGFVLSVAQSPPVATPIRSNLGWLLRRFANARAPFAADVLERFPMRTGDALSPIAA